MVAVWIALLTTVAAIIPSAKKVSLESTAGVAVDGAQGNATANGTVAEPRLFLLFMAIDRLPHQALWKTWMEGSPSKVKAFVHCKTDCPTIDHLVFNEAPRVPTAYCSDLVGAMNSLLEAAVRQPGGHPHDKFVFVSESTVPVKSFHRTYEHLTSNGNSNFCVFPRQEWVVHPPSTSGITYLGVKTHQWFILSRAHAQKSVELHRSHLINPWGIRIVYPSLSQQTSILHRGANAENATSMDDGTKVAGCVDEYWHFNAVFGTPAQLGSTTNLNGGNGLQHLVLNTPENQGVCDTYVHWAKPGANGPHGEISVLTSRLQITPHFHFQDVSRTDPRMIHPGAVASLSEQSLVALRDSPFLFARKIDASTVYHNRCETLREGIERVILDGGSSSGKPQRSYPRFNFEGQGSWIDNFGDRVTITTTELGYLRIEHSKVVDGNAEGTYDCQGSLGVLFSNGVHMRASVAKGGSQLTWQNGVIWRKNPFCFRGDGIWFDSQGGIVTVTSEGPGRLMIDNRELPQWSGRGTFNGNTLDVQFNEGSRLTAALDVSGQHLEWSHGVAWVRA
eukprot:CAMPEP_0204261482 /NCGR_PEP_ID=MMETSP0468-20130131/7029_1 /ASSEMBLY_ACC=CAM_ASM_000383 /TAXON_ID=2969 /ORGANISM="Oxyrrhis marina" /LENGTH=561 /DNA_ID=CAMNT_0051236035 /DNA_START=59 /DNA_END=1744 /DNA_ORIENTATION=+